MTRPSRLPVLGRSDSRVRAAGGFSLGVFDAAAVTGAGFAGSAVDDGRLAVRAAFAFAVRLLVCVRGRRADHQGAESDCPLRRGRWARSCHGSIVVSQPCAGNRGEARLPFVSEKIFYRQCEVAGFCVRAVIASRRRSLCRFRGSEPVGLRQHRLHQHHVVVRPQRKVVIDLLARRPRVQ